MSTSILVMGEPATGKSTSLRTLNHQETYIISSTNKSLPFREGKNKYVKGNGGNFWVCDNATKICMLMDRISQSKEDIKNIVIDDFQYILSNEYMRRSKEKGYDRFNDIGSDAFNIFEKATQCRDDLNVFILAHSIKDEDGHSKLMTIGKLIDEKVRLEGRVDILLHTFIDHQQSFEDRYKFLTQINGSTIARSPMGMFEDLMIPNDLQYVCDKIKEYNKF